MRLTTTTNVSVDGVMQGLGAPDEDRRGGFDRGGWALPLLDAETEDYLNQAYGGAAAFLFGRRTYEILAGSWGAMSDPSTSPIAAGLNSRPKYVVSTSLTDPQWASTTVRTWRSNWSPRGPVPGASPSRPIGRLGARCTQRPRST